MHLVLVDHAGEFHFLERLSRLLWLAGPSVASPTVIHRTREGMQPQSTGIKPGVAAGAMGDSGA